MTDTFLDGRVVVRQSETGFRSGVDAVMLAAAVPAQPGQAALELGAGAGTASLCLAARVAGIHVTGVEISPALAELANTNAAANAMTERACFVAADIFALPPELKRDFDHVLVNPPFHNAAGVPSPDPERAKALHDAGNLSDWLRLGLQRTVSDGFFTVVLRADRIAEALTTLPSGGVSLLPLWPRAGTAAKRAILRVRKGSGAPFALLPGFVLHQADGGYTPEAEAVLRRGKALALNTPHL